MTSRPTRRDFLKTTAAATGAAAGLRAFGVPAVLADRSPNSKLGVAVIGCGGMGGGNPGVAAGERAVALVDVDDNIMAKALAGIKDRAPRVPTYCDYRKMYDQCHKDLDVVLIATPDHHHAPAAMRAIKLGKAVFVQKPMAHDVAECYALMKAAREKNVPAQMGNQGNYGETIRTVCEYIWAGAIGKIGETHTIFGRNFGGNGPRPPSKPVPKGLHWDEWLGPAQYREYHEGLHPFSWRSWREFGTGTIGDMACHNLDCLFWALRVAEAKQYSITCLAQKPGNDEMYPTDNVLLWEVPARGDMPPVKIHAYDHGGLMPPVMQEVQKKYKINFGECTLYVGQQGLMRTEGTAGGWQFIPYERGKEIPKPPKTLPRAHGGPIGDLFYVLRNGGTPCSDFVTSAGPLAAFALSGHLAMLAGVGKKVEWDVEKMQSTNMPDVDRFARREYRPGWEL
ncbi:MAG: Gfo/Idh/MocA family oxidoreductase [Thermoguttaceae bacterium]|jgi:predicted dehydrogenase